MGPSRQILLGVSLLLVFGLVGVLVSIGPRPESATVLPTPHVLAEDLQVIFGLGPPVPATHLLSGKKVRLVDGRSLNDFTRAHLYSAIHLDVALARSSSATDPVEFIVVYADSEEAAEAAVAMLQARMFPNVCILRGGIGAAVQAGIPMADHLDESKAPLPGNVRGAAVLHSGWTSIASPVPKDGVVLRIVATSRLQGILEGCGCGVTGIGLARMATLLAHVREAEFPSVLIDAGGFFTGTDELDQLRSIEALKILSNLGYRSMAAGIDAARFGSAFLRGPLSKSPVPFLSANLHVENARVFPASAMLVQDGVRIAVVGATASSAPEGAIAGTQGSGLGSVRAGVNLSTAKLPPGVEVRDLAGILESELEQAWEHADVVIVVGGVTVEDAQRLSRSSHAPTVIVSNLAPPPNLTGLIGGRIVPKEGRDYLATSREWRLALPPTSIHFLGNHPIGSLAWIDLTRSALAGRRQSAVEREEGYGVAIGSVNGIEKDRMVDDAVQAFFSRVKGDRELQRGVRPRLADLAEESDPDNSYVGYQQCAKCHEDATKQWASTKHARSYQTLEKLDRHYYPSCVSCHTTGVRSLKPGSQIEAAPAFLAGVQCEVCHGPGAKHIRNPVTSTIRRMAGKELCLRCHSGVEGKTFTDELELEQARGRILHQDKAKSRSPESGH